MKGPAWCLVAGATLVASASACGSAVASPADVEAVPAAPGTGGSLPPPAPEADAGAAEAVADSPTTGRSFTIRTSISVTGAGESPQPAPQ